MTGLRQSVFLQAAVGLIGHRHLQHTQSQRELLVMRTEIFLIFQTQSTHQFNATHLALEQLEHTHHYGGDLGLDLFAPPLPHPEHLQIRWVKRELQPHVEGW